MLAAGVNDSILVVVLASAIVYGTPLSTPRSGSCSPSARAS